MKKPENASQLVTPTDLRAGDLAAVEGGADGGGDTADCPPEGYPRRRERPPGTTVKNSSGRWGHPPPGRPAHPVYSPYQGLQPGYPAFPPTFTCGRPPIYW